MLLLLPMAVILKGPPAAILEISVVSEQRRGKLCHSISIQSTYFVRQLSVENVKVFIFVSVTPLYSSDGPLTMATVKIDSQKSMVNPVLFLRSVGYANTVVTSQHVSHSYFIKEIENGCPVFI